MSQLRQQATSKVSTTLLTANAISRKHRGGSIPAVCSIRSKFRQSPKTDFTVRRQIPRCRPPLATNITDPFRPPVVPSSVPSGSDFDFYNAHKEQSFSGNDSLPCQYGRHAYRAGNTLGRVVIHLSSKLQERRYTQNQWSNISLKIFHA